MEETGFNNYTFIDTTAKDTSEYVKIDCDNEKTASNLNLENEWKDVKDNRYFMKSTVCKFVSVVVVAILFAGCGNLLYLLITGTREIKLVIPNGYVLLPKQDVPYKSKTSEMTPVKMTSVEQVFTTTEATRTATIATEITSTPKLTTQVLTSTEAIRSATEATKLTSTPKLTTQVLTSTEAIRSTTVTEASEITSTPSATTIEQGCRTGWMTFGYHFSDEKKTWQEAFDSCLETGGYLIEINSAAEDKVISDKAKSIGGNFWIGLSDMRTETMWVWNRSGTAITPAIYTNWAPNQPDDGSRTEDCALLEQIYSYLWNDDQCYNTHKYICEIDIN